MTKELKQYKIKATIRSPFVILDKTDLKDGIVSYLEEINCLNLVNHV